jgi:hypothetical protein
MLIEDRIIAAGKMFEDRLDAALLLWALDYVNFGECAVAVDMLADQLVDHEVRLTAAEFEEVQTVAKLTGAGSVCVLGLGERVRE